jgi:cytochrome P450
MALVTDLELPVLDYLGPDLKGERFHDTMRELSERSWIASSPIGFIVLDREAAAFFLRTRSATFPGMRIAEMFEVPEGPLLEEMRRNILHINGDAHRRLRNLVNPAFTPRAADRWRPAMRKFLERLWVPLEGAGSCEFVEAFAKPYPSLTIATVMGAPLEDAPKLHDWSNRIQRQFDPASLMGERELIERACEEFYEWAGALIERRRDDPGDDLISTLIAAEQDGDRLSEAECMNLVLNVLVGGVDTTQSQLAHGLRVFAAHPEQWELLAAEPERATAAVEELLRYEPITPFTARILHEEVEYRDVTFPADTIVMVCSFTGNRDGVEGDPEMFDITSERGDAKPLTFGAGIHYCLGANLARAELQEALGFLPQRMPGLALDGEPELGSIHGIYGLERLPVRWT